MTDYVQRAPELFDSSGTQCSHGGACGRSAPRASSPPQVYVLNKKIHSDPGSLRVIAQPPPALPTETVAGHLACHYGLEGPLQPLVSERDQNFRLQAGNGTSYVVKIANAAENRDATELQVAVLQHLAKQSCPVAVPVPLPSRDGSALTAIDHAGIPYSLRVVSWLHGRPAEDVGYTVDFAFALGQALAHIDVALAGFECRGDGQHLLWDMRHAGDLRALVHHVASANLRQRVESCLADFEASVLPAFPTLRTQIIHNDLNPGNVLVANDNLATVAGVIDFGDMVRAPLVVDVAVALSYMRRFSGDPLELPATFVAGYSAVQALGERELALLYDLVRIRLATTITILYWRAAARGSDDPYLEKSLAERGAERFLDVMDAISRDQFAHRLLAAASA